MSTSNTSSGTQVDYELFDPSSKPRGTREGVGFMQVGAVAGLAGVGYMIRNFKNKSKDMKLSVYVIHTRMFAQGSVIAILSLGMIAQMYKKYTNRPQS